MTAAARPSSATYADHGIVCAYRFDANGIATSIPVDEPITPVGTPGEGFEWLHFNLSDTRAQNWIKATPDLPDTAKRIMLAADAHHCIDHDGAFVWGIFSDLLYDSAGSTDAQLGHLHFAFGERVLVSGRRRPLAAVDKARSTIDRGACVPAPVALLEKVVHHVVAEIVEVVAALVHEMDLVEEQTLAVEATDERRRLTPLRRSAVRLRRQIGGLSTIFRRFEELEPSELPPGVQATAVRLSQRLESLLHEVTAIQERARLLQDEVVQKLTAQTNRHLYVLSILTTLLLPPTLVTGFFGMNTKGLLFADNEIGTLYAAVMCIVAAGAVYFVMRRQGMMK